MNVWDIRTLADGVLGISDVADEISALVSSISVVLEQVGNIDPIWELSDRFPLVGRSVVQLRVSPELFEAFFNSSAGYRAMFRRGRRIGSLANAALVDAVQSRLAASLPEVVDAHHIKAGLNGPDWIRRAAIPKPTFLRSLDPSLAKVWYSTAEVQSNGEIRRLPFGVSDGKIDVGLSNHWAEIRQDAEDCIIEVKGAFVGSCGLFQIKDPELRARTLSEKGEA
jgi:hypothetical protein